MKIFLLIIWYFTISFASRHSENTLNPVIRNPFEVYKEEKAKYLRAYRHELRFLCGVSKIYKDSPELVHPIQNLCNQLSAEQLLVAMNEEDSLKFLVAFWFSSQSPREVLVFDNIKSLFNLNNTHYFAENLFLNFRNYVSQAVRKSKREDSSAGIAILSAAWNLWQNKLKQVGRRILTPVAFEKIKRLIEDRLHFCDIFLSHRTEELLIQQYWKLVPEIEGGIDRITPAIQNFCFLTTHLWDLIRNVNSPTFLSNLEWLAEETPMKIIHILYFMKFSFLDLILDYSINNSKMIDLMKTEVESYIQLKDGKMPVFGDRIIESLPDADKITWLVKRILEKTSKVPKTLCPGARVYKFFSH
jgi:hypothetical protein